MVQTQTLNRLPAWFLTHGGGEFDLLEGATPNLASRAIHKTGPLPILGDKQHAEIVRHWKTLASTLPGKPTAILMVSGHHEETIPTVTTSASPPMLYDYRGFPAEAYKLKYSAPGHPEVAGRILQKLRDAGWDHSEDSSRGYDHGVFVPLHFIFPQADVPVVQLSLMSNMDAERHIELGEVIAPLRDEGILVIGSGASWHNNRDLDWQNGPASKKSVEFDDWIRGVLAEESLSPLERKAAFAKWAQAPQARYSHPREEHLLPAHVLLGSANSGQASVIYQGSLFGAAISSFQWD